MEPSPTAHRLRIAHVSTFPSLKCGIALFATDLIGSIADADHRKYSLHYGHDGSADSWADADVNSRDEVVGLAHSISRSDCDVVCLQHEFGIWGGAEGEHLIPFLQSLTKPLVSVLHTTFDAAKRTARQREMLLDLIARSARAICLTEASRTTLEQLARRRLDNVAVVPHGVHRFAYKEPPASSIARLRLITPGFFRPDKGFEIVIEALRQLKSRGHEFSYLIAGEPQSQFEDQQRYCASVRQTIDRLGLNDIARCDVRFLSVGEQVALIQDCDAGVFAYQDRAQSSSGTMPLVLSAGRPLICTPFEYARAKQQEGLPVVVADGFSSGDIASAILAACGHWTEFNPCLEAYRLTATWRWPEVGTRFARELKRVAVLAD
jgi:glycosyltransferase involved in cell wall biosynthesis